VIWILAFTNAFPRFNIRPRLPAFTTTPANIPA